MPGEVLARGFVDSGDPFAVGNTRGPLCMLQLDEGPLVHNTHQDCLGPYELRRPPNSPHPKGIEVACKRLLDQ